MQYDTIYLVTNDPLHYYSQENVRTCNGVLRLTTAIKPRNFTEYNPTTGRDDQQYKEIQSAMLQSWNKFCFTGGIVEFSAKLPGSSKVGGLWPAVWMMGNLARATYVNSSERLWPFSTNVCDDRTRYSQLINSCFDTSNPHHMPNDRGRGAPEIDLLECMYMADLFEHPILSVSLQVAPGIVAPKHRPVPGHAPNRVSVWMAEVVCVCTDCPHDACLLFICSSATHPLLYCVVLPLNLVLLFLQSQSWYEGIEYGNSSSLNTYFYGTKVWQKEKRQNYQTDALSINTVLSDDHFYNQHIYRMEWEPPNEVSAGGYLKWFLDGHLIAAIHGDSLQEASQTEIPSEPMYLILNTAISKDWAFPDAYFLNCPKKCWSCLDPDCACALPKGFCENLPATMEIDYVRVYQRQQQQPEGDGTSSSSSSQHTFGCSPPSRPTADFIEARREKYMLEGQRRPLEPVPTGGGSCVNDHVCAPGGTCSVPSHTCVCQESWTGPYCRAHRAYSDEDDDGGLASILAMWLCKFTFALGAECTLNGFIANFLQSS